MSRAPKAPPPPPPPPSAPPAAGSSSSPPVRRPEPLSEAVTMQQPAVMEPAFTKSQERSPKSALLLAAVLACVALGVCYYAFLLWQSKHSAEVQLTSAKGEVERLHKQTVETDGRVKVLQEEQTARLTELSTANGQIKELSEKLAATEGKLDELAEARAEVEQQLAEFKGFSKQFQRMIDTGRLEVNLRRGRMIVELPAQVLFPSGSADLTDDGKQALSEVAKVLRKIRNKRFIVGGHTDNVPVSTEAFHSNWELSAARAVNVTRALIGAGMSPRRLVATGYAQYDPVATNKSSRGRQRNRRIEIILEPKLRELPGVDKNEKG